MKGAGKENSQDKGKEKFQKGRGKGETHPESGLLASEAPEDGESDD